MRQIVLHTAKAIANDPARPGVPVFNDAGTILKVPSPGLTVKQAGAWLRDGSAVLHKPVAKA